MTKIENKTIPQLIRSVWTVLSELVRLEEDVCYTCGKGGDWKEAQGGHYIHGKKYPYSYFERRNVHRQCVRCNKWLNGNLSVYAERLVEQYGRRILGELRALKNLSKPPREWYEGRLIHFSQQLRKVRKLKGVGHG